MQHCCGISAQPTQFCQAHAAQPVPQEFSSHMVDAATASSPMDALWQIAMLADDCRLCGPCFLCRPRTICVQDQVALQCPMPACFSRNLSKLSQCRSLVLQAAAAAATTEYFLVSLCRGSGLLSAGVSMCVVYWSECLCHHNAPDFATCTCGFVSRDACVHAGCPLFALSHTLVLIAPVPGGSLL